MSISHRTNRLKLVGQPSVEKLQNGRYKLVVTCSTMNSREDWYSANKARIFPDFGSLQSAEMSIDGLAPRTGEAYADMRLTQVESGNRSAMGGTGDYVVVLTYETLGSAFVQVKDDDTDYELNGLRRVTRTSIAEAGTDYAKTVGTSYIDHQIDAEAAVRCYLASYAIDDTDSFRQVQEVYLEAGQISKSEVQGPDGLPDTKTVTYVSQITEPTSSGILLSKNVDNTEGYKIYTYKYLEGQTAGGTPIGDLQSYEQVIEVRKAGSVTATGGSSSTLPYITSIPPRIGKVKANVTISLTSDNTVSVPVAYNLSDTSCSATTVNTKVTPIGVEQGGSLTVAVYNTRQTTSHQPFSNYYATNTGDSGSITSAASIVRDNDNIIGSTLNETSSSSIVLTGSSTEPVTTGIYDQILDPVFIDATGTQYYRKTTYTIA